MKKSSDRVNGFLEESGVLKSFSWSDLALVLILCLGIFLRFWQLESKMIFFADAGRDMLVAQKMATIGEIPLLGIPSSVPRFKQGPLFIWFEALVFKVTGHNPLAVGYSMAFLSSASLLGCYLLLRKNVSTSAGLFATLLLAASPLAVAHSRMPYHITPIIFFLLLYLRSIQRLIEQKPLSIFLAALSFGLLFQFELALFPLLLLIPFILWRQQFFRKFFLIDGLFGLSLGLIPQIIFDFTHHFEQLGGFALWLVYRVVSFFWIGKSHAVSQSSLQQAWNIFIHYFSRIFSLDIEKVGICFLILLLISVAFLLRYQFKNLFLQSTCLGLVILLLALLVHGTPSEAYFPPIILLACISIGSALALFPIKWRAISAIAVIAVALINTRTIIKNNFFTLPTNSEFQYGSSYQEQKNVMQFVLHESAGKPIELRSTDPDAHFETYLDNYRVIGMNMDRSAKFIKQGIDAEQEATQRFIIDKQQSEMASYPGAKISFWPNTFVIELPKDL